MSWPIGALALATLLSAPVPVDGEPDARSVEWFYYSCQSELGRRDITLFANGTVRLRQGLWEAQELYLEELGPEALADYRHLLEQIHSAKDWTISGRQSISGPWVQQCEIKLELPDLEALEFRFDGYEIPPLAVSRLVHLAENLAETTRPLDSPERLPHDYEPRRGDILVTAEGQRFKVLRRTTDGRAVELQGIDQPLRIFVPLEEMSEAFSSRVEPGEER